MHRLKKIVITCFLLLATTIVLGQEQTKFIEKLEALMLLITHDNIQEKQVELALQNLVNPAGNNMEVTQVDYSIYPKFEGQKLYYIPYKNKQDDRFSMEQLIQGNQVVYSLQLFLNSPYSLVENQVVYQNPNYFYNCNLQEFKNLCTQAIKYTKGVANTQDTTVLSCVYVNALTNKKLMFWVVLKEALGNKEGNEIVQIKIQDTRLWQN